jgi:hypothetical protein
MKKYLRFAYVGAIALIGAYGFTACSSADEITGGEINPTYDPVAKTVTTQFVLNVANGEMNSTRQSADIVQKNTNFRGMQNAKLIALSTGNSSYMAPYAGTSTVTPGFTGVNKTFDLGTLYGSSAVVAENNETSSSNRILELAMPLQTDAMLVYGRAIPNADMELNGQVTMNVGVNPENTTFDLVSRINGRTTEYTQTCALGATILNRVLGANSSGVGAGDFSHNGYTNAVALPAITWKGIADSYKAGTPLAPLTEVLAKAYATLTTINPGELRAGSGSALFSIFKSLYATATSVYGATATNDGEANAQRLAIEIRNRIGNYFNLVSDEVSEWKSIGNASETNTIIYNLISAGIVNNTSGDANYWETKFGEVKTGDLKNLPTAFNLPVGAAILYLDTDGNFTYKNPSTSLLDQSQTTKAANYMYPAELLYFDNSALRVNDGEMKAADYPNGVNPWDTETSWTAKGWTSGAVTSTTRSVAVKNNINYGVAMLKTVVTLDGTSFKDNRSAIVTSEADQTLSDDDVKQFKLTGVLIGGQNHQLGWNYLFKSNASTDWDYVIFDNKINGSGAIPTPSGEENYTLVFDNCRANATSGLIGQTDQTDVLVALEFENTSKDFYGKGNMIRYGGKFYLVGKLALGSNTIADSNWPTYYAIPPYTATGATDKITRVFVQDFMTTATFKIGANSLKNAFVTVPDLRSSQTSLGLSVDLKWQPGLNFESVILGQ